MEMKTSQVDHALVGTWAWYEYLNWVYILSKDGTAIRGTYYGYFEFTWGVYDNELCGYFIMESYSTVCFFPSQTTTSTWKVDMIPIPSFIVYASRGWMRCLRCSSAVLTSFV